MVPAQRQRTGGPTTRLIRRRGAYDDRRRALAVRVEHELSSKAEEAALAPRLRYIIVRKG
jgi:hypothetical protein